jgi:hypothetical protein
MLFCFARVSLARRHPLSLTLFLVLCGNCCRSQSVPPGLQVQSSSAHVLTGTVVNSTTGTPIPFALVQVEQNAKLTDQNGNFQFENLLSGVVNVQAHKPGFFAENEIGGLQAPPVTNLSDHPTTVTVRLVPEAVITGHVENPEGDPLGRMPLSLRVSQVVNGRRVWQGQGQRQTDEDGNFRIADLKPGTYYVEAGPNSRARPTDQGDGAGEKFQVVPAEYYPGVREISAATPVRVTPGQHVALEFAMKRVPAFRLSGAITGATANAGQIMLLDRDGDNVNLGLRYDNRTGRFQAFPVPAGSYRIRYNGRDAEGQQMFADVPIDVSGDIPELRVPVERTISVQVEFNTDFTRQNSGESMPGGFVYSGPPVSDLRTLHRQGFNGQLHLTSRTPPYQQFYAVRESEGGAMLIRGLEPGTYDVEVNANGASYVASVTCGGLNLLSEPLVIAEGADPQPIQVMLRDDGASLSGAVQMPEAGRPALVLMVADGDAQSPRQIWVDGSGKFQAQEIAPGSYEVLALDRADGIEYRNREVLGEYLSHAAHVTLSPEQQAKVTVDLIRTHE